MDLADLPAAFYGTAAYTTPNLHPELSTAELARASKVGIEPGTISSGSARLVPFSLAESGFVLTPIQAFPWNQLRLDGQPVPTTDLRCWTDHWHGKTPGFQETDPVSHNLAVWVPAGAHVLAYRWEPAPPLQPLRTLNFVTLALFGGGLGALGFVALCRRVRQNSR